jgi:serine/threonine protein kinase/tetratricopeptide (TPR) repeat protein
MRPERWQKVREVLDQALELSASDRSNYLQNCCANDEALRAEVESLLQAHLSAGDAFLNDPAADLKSVLPVLSSRSNRIGSRLGGYQIVEEIGHGGMGDVYRAMRVDGQYHKEVAIKLVRVGMDSPFLLERFRHERQILASLDHPNIARLYDGGTTEDGIPYLVMELIEGTPIDRYCEEQDLGISERLQLFSEVCAAVQYAHQRLVIHRDIKPSNILVTAEGVPKLLDFGIAKIKDSSPSPETTLLRPMTPEYASPEQVRGEPITTAGDVYSLGVVMYLLLTRRSPYPEKTRTPLEFAKLICEVEPTRPSTAVMRPMKAADEEHRAVATGWASPAKVRRALTGDLDNIVLKALRKEPERRYVSAEQLAEDIRRHLQGLPVLATPDSSSYRVRKFVGRHKAGVAATVLIAVAVAGGVAATLREARVAVQERARAERRFNDVRKLANSFLFEFDEAIKNLPGSTPARSLVVKRALQYLDGLAAEARGDRSLQLEIAAAYKRVGEVQGDPMFPNLGDSQGALKSSGKALEILETLSRTEPENQQVRLALASTQQQISDVLAFGGDMAGAVQHSGIALKINEGLAANLASDPKFQSQLVSQTYHYAKLLQLVGTEDEAGAEYRQAVELSQRMIAANPSDQEGKVHLASSLDGLGDVLQEKADTAGALENRRRGLTIREELARLDPNNANYRRQLAFSHHNVGLSLVQAGDLASALIHFQQELRLFESLSVADPKDVQARRNRSLAHKQIGDVRMRNGDVRAALAQYRSALGIDRDLASADPDNSQAVLDLSFSESKVGSALGKLGQTREALLILEGAVSKQESLLAKDPHHILLYNHLANSYTRLADCLLDSADRKAAIVYYRKAVAARVRLSEKSPTSSTNRGALAECYMNLAKALAPREREEALKQYSNAVDILERLTAADRSNARYRVALADALSNTARQYVGIAAQEKAPPAMRLQYWSKARSFYLRSQELWLELGKASKLPPARSRAFQEVSVELARCTDSVAKLQGLH